MKMVSTLPNGRNWKRINGQLTSFAGGLALATVAIIGGGQLLGANSDTASVPSRAQVETRSIGPVMDEPDFRSTAGEIVPQPIGYVMDEPDSGSLGEESVLAQAAPAAAVTELEATLVDPTDFGSLGVESVLAQPSYAPEAAVDYSLPTTFAADFLGTGQPSEGVESAEASDAALFGTMVDAVYVIESDIQIP